MADEVGWIDWAGGECPVAADAKVRVKLRRHDGEQLNRAYSAGVFRWSNFDLPGDIMAYRVVSE